MSARTVAVQALRARATKLEDAAIQTAEADLDHVDWPRAALSRTAHAELRLKAAAILRARAGERGR